MLTEEQIALYARQILVIGGAGQEKLCAARVNAAPGSLVARYLEASGTTVAADGEALCPKCTTELGDDPLVAFTFQQRVLSGSCPRHP